MGKRHRWEFNALSWWMMECIFCSARYNVSASGPRGGLRYDVAHDDDVEEQLTQEEKDEFFRKHECKGGIRCVK